MVKKILFGLTIVSTVFLISCSSKQQVQTDTALPPPQQSTVQETRSEPLKEQKPTELPQQPTIKQETILKPEQKKVAPKHSTKIAELQSSINDIYFEFDKYDVSPADMPTIKKVADILLSDTTLSIIIEGHCDERGTNEYNLGLGDKRASAVKSQLQAKGVPASKIQVISYGEEKPVCTHSEESCWAKNRRAHIVLVEGSK